MPSLHANESELYFGGDRREAGRVARVVEYALEAWVPEVGDSPYICGGTRREAFLHALAGISKLAILIKQ
jgi:hypothetical protein